MAIVKPVEQWGIGDATGAASSELPKDYPAVRALIEDQDAWQEGRLWPGHRTGDPVTDAAIRENVKPQFISDDVASELVENRTNGLLGQEADVVLVPLEPGPDGVPTAAQQQEIDRVVGALSAWWDQKRLWEKIGTALGRVSYAGRATVRAFVAEGNIVTQIATGETPERRVLPSGKPLAEAFDLIDLDTPLPNLAVRYVDPRTQRASAVIVTDTDGQQSAEVWTVDRKTKRTELKTLGTGAREAPFPFDLQGRLPLAEMRGKRIVTPSVVKLQSLLNFIMTVTARTVETAGFRERYLKNVEPPGMWLPTLPVNSPPLAVDDSGPTKLYKHRVPWVLGASITNELIGIRTVETKPDGTAVEVVGSPDVQALEPVAPAFATDAASVVRKALYQRGKQAHLAMDSTAQSSGTAYQQARAQFETDLKTLKGPAEGMIRDLVEVALAYVGLMCEEAKGLLARYRVQVTLRVSAGPITADDARAAVELRDKRVISQQTTMARCGIEDPGAEQAAIETDPLQIAAFWTAMAPAFSALTAIPDVTAEQAGFLLKLTPEQIQVLATGTIPGQAPATTKPTLSAA